MLWHKSWLDTRWRFLGGLAVMACSAVAIVLAYPRLMALANSTTIDASGPFAEEIQEAIGLSREYRGYIWGQWFRQTPIQLMVLIAALLGSGGLVGQSNPRSQLFTLSLPVSRARLVGVRAATGVAQLFAVAMLPALLIPVLSPAVGQSYAVGTALVHALCLFVAAAVFFSLALLLSTVFDDVWKPLVITLVAAVLAGVFEYGVGFGDGTFHTMTGERYFRSGSLPWVGLSLSASAAAAMVYVSVLSLQRRDF